MSAWDAWWSAHGEGELRAILMTAWDPLGSGVAEEAWDEYDAYLLEIAQRLRDTGDEEQAMARVAAYLASVEEGSMGLTPLGDPRAHRRLAERLVAWHAWSTGRAS